MPEFDLQDPTDLDIMRGQFNMLSHEDFEEYIEKAEANNISYKQIKVLKSSSRKVGIAKYLSPKVINWVLNIMERLDEIDEDDEYEDED